MLAVAVVVLIGVFSLWFDSDLARMRPKLVAAASPQGVAVLWREATPNADALQFKLAQRRASGPWSAPASFCGRYRAAAMLGQQIVVFFQRSYSAYAQGRRSKSKPWPFDWEPAAAAGIGDKLYALGQDKRLVRVACKANGAWKQLDPIVDIRGEVADLVAMGQKGALAVSISAYDAKRKKTELSLFERVGGRWRRTPVPISPTDLVKAVAVRGANGIWVVTLRERTFGGRQLIVARRTTASAKPAAHLTLESVDDFTLTRVNDAAAFVVARKGRIEMTDLDAPGTRSWEVVYRGAEPEAGNRILGTVGAALLLCLVVVAANNFGRQQARVATALERGERTLAGLSRRVVAYVVDCTIAVGAAYGISLLFFGADMTVFGLTAVLQCVRLVYMTWFEFSTGQTVGKRLMGIRVVTLQGQRLSLGAALVRNLLRMVDDLFCIGLVVMVWNRRLQRMGDLMAGTLVVRVRAAKNAPGSGSQPPADA